MELKLVFGGLALCVMLSVKTVDSCGPLLPLLDCLSSCLYYCVIEDECYEWFNDQLDQLPNPANDDDPFVKRIRQFGNEVEEIVPHEYMSEDWYLARYMVARKFDVKRATIYLQHNLEWRTAQKIDSILEEDWSDYNSRFRYDLTTITKKGRPVLYIPFSEWNITQEVKNGEMKRLVRYTSAKIMEDAEHLARSLRTASNQFARFDIVVNLGQNEIDMEGCPECVQFFSDIFREITTRYPMSYAKLFFINAPPSAASSFEVLKEAFGKSALSNTVLLGGPEVYEPVLLQYMENEQLRKMF